MHVEEVPNAVASAVRVVKTDVPQRFAGQRVEVLSLDLIRKNRTAQTHLALEDTRETFTLELGRLAKVPGARDVRSAVPEIIYIIN